MVIYDPFKKIAYSPDTAPEKRKKYEGLGHSPRGYFFYFSTHDISKLISTNFYG